MAVVQANCKPFPQQLIVKVESEMLSEYEFSKGDRGKHADQYRLGQVVRVHYTDGTVSIQEVPPSEGTVVLAQDVREFFPDSNSVNYALRTLISLFAKKNERE